MYRVVIVEDDSRPLITVLENNPYTIEYSATGETYNDLSVSVYDLTDPNVNITVDTSNIKTSVLGTYSVIYNATDEDGLQAIEKYRTVIVSDRTPLLSHFSKNPHTIKFYKCGIRARVYNNSRCFSQ